MKYLSIDYGKKNIGLAVSDSSGIMAFPHSIIDNDKNAFDKVLDIIQKEQIEEIVSGESVDLEGEENEINSDIKYFTNKLEKETGLRVNFEKEWFTSTEARWGQSKTVSKGHRRGDKKLDASKKIDDSAAALILKTFLEKKNNLL